MSESINARKGIKTDGAAHLVVFDLCPNQSMPVRALRQHEDGEGNALIGKSESINARKGIKTERWLALAKSERFVRINQCP